jgi:hypothetical protein
LGQIITSVSDEFASLSFCREAPRFFREVVRSVAIYCVTTHKAVVITRSVEGAGLFLRVFDKASWNGVWWWRGGIRLVAPSKTKENLNEVMTASNKLSPQQTVEVCRVVRC